MVKSKINVDADKRFHLRITQWSYPICDSWTSTSIRHWFLASQPTSKEYCTVCLWEIFNIILYFPVDCLFRVKTITLETANVTNCHVIATDVLFLSSNHRSVQFLYLAATAMFVGWAVLVTSLPSSEFHRHVRLLNQWKSVKWSSVWSVQIHADFPLTRSHLVIFIRNWRYFKDGLFLYFVVDTWNVLPVMSENDKSAGLWKVKVCSCFVMCLLMVTA